jgi:membrane protein implicated in regulation of membrane protease activity
MTWWAWMILGAVLFGAELFAIDAQFYLVFLGLSAALVGLADLAGLVMPEWAQWLVFAALSLISMFTFRQSLYDRIRGDVPGFKDSVDGEYLVIPQELATGAQGRASFRGSDWTVVNEGNVAIAAGARAKIARSEGLTLYVRVDP